MALYQKYRPQTVAELDNTAVSKLIVTYLTRKEIPHAFLFTGSKGTGKTSSARIIAKSINCLSPKTGLACGECEVCTSIARGDHLDILEIDAASNRGIDEIRELREKIKLAPTQLKYKVYIIDEVHMLTTEAFNALLKTIEEPPKHAVFILATTEAHKVPDTIISRCVRINFHKAGTDEILHSLKRAVKGEGLVASDEALALIAEVADGSFRDGHKILEELSSSEITLDAVKAHVGDSDQVVYTRVIELIHAKKSTELLACIQELATQGKNMPQFFLTLLRLLEKELIAVYSEGKSVWDKEELKRLLTILSGAYGQLKFSPIPQLPLELALLQYCDESPLMAKKTTSVAATASAPTSAVVHSNALISEDEASVAPFKNKWDALIDDLKGINHSISGVMRSCRPVLFKDNTLTIEAAYKFHAERLREPAVMAAIGKSVKNVVGLDVKIEVVLKKR